MASDTLLYAFLASKTHARPDEYPLFYSLILDSGTTLHVFNDLSRFYNLRKAPRGHSIVAGNSQVPILAYGDVDITVKGPHGPQTLRLRDTAYCTDFQCNLVSFDKLQQRGYYWDTRKELLMRENNTILCHLDRIKGQRVLEYVPASTARNRTFSAFATTRRRRRTTRDPRPSSFADGHLWHHRMGHIGRWPLHHLGKQVLGVKLRGPCTAECEHCAVAKIKKKISRRPPERPLVKKACHEIHIDWTDLKEDHQGYLRVMFITCRWTGMVFPYFMTTHGTQRENLRVLKDFVRWCKNRYKLKIKVIRSDNELNRGATQEWLRKEGITFEPSAPDTHDQNGRAERSGGVIIVKARAMRIAAKLPHDLWLESINSATYLFNRTPRYTNGWQTPYERFYTYLDKLEAKDQGQAKPRKPQLAHLKAYGYRAYAMTKDAKLKRKRLMKLDPRAHIRYLVGYDSTNIYRI